MTKANGLKDKRLIKGKQRKPAVPKDKFGKRILMDNMNTLTGKLIFQIPVLLKQYNLI